MKTLKRTMLEIEGMTCGSCVRHVDKALRSQTGVVAVTVALREGTADVVYHQDETSPAALKSVVERAGYVVRDEKPSA